MDGFLSRRTYIAVENVNYMLVRQQVVNAHTPGNQNSLPNDMTRALRENIEDLKETMHRMLKLFTEMLDGQSLKLDAQAKKLDAQASKLDAQADTLAAQAKKLDAQATQLQPENFREYAIKLLSDAKGMIQNLDNELQDARIIRRRIE